MKYCILYIESLEWIKNQEFTKNPKKNMMQNVSNVQKTSALSYEKKNSHIKASIVGRLKKKRMQ